ncbi:flagellar hook-basal body complex protein FliE [Chelativorans sp. YIM 93263]|uniref:flagellar hook-basal body complex protein FliE n=1 Tax=Chelativorans sp. YIM 93263 TaxID=2906648 RepID=UPI00237853FD|nr:flagellar hook-basal body complex protein FliE [Chelativorans sp. YIM 93263]
MITGIGDLTRLPGLQEIPQSRPTAPDSDAFSAMVAEFATTTVNRLENAENLSIQALQGEANTREVVDAVMTAEQSLQSAIAIRDKIVTAYMEISRMAI